MKTAVIGDDAEAGHVVYNRTLLDFARHHGFLPKACRAYRAKTKGKVERPFRYVREDFFLGGRSKISTTSTRSSGSGRGYRRQDALSDPLAYEIADGVSDLLTPSVGDRNRQPEAGMCGGRRFRLAQHGDRRRRQELQPPHGSHANAAATGRRISGQGGDLELDRRENAGDLARIASDIDRTYPKRDRRNVKFGGPRKHVVELFGADARGFTRVDKAMFTSISAIAIEDDPDVLRRLACTDWCSSRRRSQ